MKINWNKTKVMVMGARPSRMNIKIENSKLEQVNSFRYLGSLLQENGRCSKEIRTRIAMANEAFNKKKNLFCGKLKKNMRKRLLNCFAWSVLLN